MKLGRKVGSEESVLDKHPEGDPNSFGDVVSGWRKADHQEPMETPQTSI